MYPVNMKAPPPASGQFKVIIAEHQPEYTPIPAIVDRQSGWVCTEWALTTEEMAQLLAGGRVRLWTLTKGQPFQPIAPEIVGPEDTMALEPVN